MSGDNAIVRLPLRRRRPPPTPDALDDFYNGDSLALPADPADTSELMLLLRNIDRSLARIAAALSAPRQPGEGGMTYAGAFQKPRGLGEPVPLRPMLPRIGPSPMPVAVFLAARM